MAWIGRMVRETWVATLLFALASMIGFSMWSGANASFFALMPIVLIAPPIWWRVAAHRQPIRLGRGAVGGALIGLVSLTIAFIAPVLIQVIRTPRRLAGGGGLGDWGLALVLMIVVGGVIVGVVVGVVAAAIQRLLGHRAPIGE